MALSSADNGLATADPETGSIDNAGDASEGQAIYFTNVNGDQVCHAATSEDNFDKETVGTPADSLRFSKLWIAGAQTATGLFDATAAAAGADIDGQGIEFASANVNVDTAAHYGVYFQMGQDAGITDVDPNTLTNGLTGVDVTGAGFGT